MAAGINMQLVLPLKLGGKANRELWLPNGNLPFPITHVAAFIGKKSAFLHMTCIGSGTFLYTLSP